MKKTFTGRFWSLGTIACFTLLSFGSCNKDKQGCTDPTATNYDPDATNDCCCEYSSGFATEVHFHPYVGTEPMAEGGTYMFNGNAMRIDNARFYVSNMRAVDANGNETPMEVKYLFVTPDPDEYEVGNLPAGDYAKIRFDVGIDSATNHADPSQWAVGDPLGPQSPSMQWGWTMGYIFLRLDGSIDTDGDGTPDDPVIIHLGTDPYLAHVEVDYPLTIGDGQENIFHMIADWSLLFSGLDILADHTTQVTDDPTLAGEIDANIPGMFYPEP